MWYMERTNSTIRRIDPGCLSVGGNGRFHLGEGRRRLFVSMHLHQYLKKLSPSDVSEEQHCLYTYKGKRSGTKRGKKEEYISIRVEE